MVDAGSDAASAGVAAADPVERSIFDKLGTRKVSLSYATAHVFSGALDERMIDHMFHKHVGGVCPSWAAETLACRWCWSRQVSAVL